MNDNSAQTNLLALAQQMWQGSVGIVKDIVAIFLLEVKLANKSIMTILGLALFATILLLSIWFSLLGALVVWLLSNDISIILSLAIVCAINIVLAILVGFIIYRTANNLHFKETRQQLELSRSRENETITS